MRRLIAEFEPQSFVQLIFPQRASDWAPYLEEARGVIKNIALAVARHQQCLLVCEEIAEARSYFDTTDNIRFVEYTCDDTWARDSSAISVESPAGVELLDFTFNGWGNKFDASRDNAMSRALSAHYGAALTTMPYVLEGGGIESNGNGILMSTAECLHNPNRNPHMTTDAIDAMLRETFGVQKILWLHNGYLSGDDTDSHIDTLARFIGENSIMYVKCEDKTDEHYEALAAMERELQAFRNLQNEPFELIALPMTDAIYYDDERLPATYANFLIINGAVLVPVYNDPHDEEALMIFKNAFAQREIIAIDCSVLIRQHGSLHCVSMQFPKGVPCK